MKKIISIGMLFMFCYFNVVYADKIAVIGGGAAGLVTAWLLEENHEVTLYEAQDRIGGHADSIDIQVDGEPVTIDAGFEFFNEEFYPHFVKLIRYFKLPMTSYTLVTTFYRTDGSDVIMLPPIHGDQVEWKSLTPCNVLRALQLKTITDNGRKLLKDPNRDVMMSLETFVDTLPVTKSFKTVFLYPLVAAGWGVTPNEIRDFSAYDTTKFLVESSDTKDYQWYEITDGTHSYINAVIKSLRNTAIKLNAKVTQVQKNKDRYLITAADGSLQTYDQVIFATNANAASVILSSLPEASDLSALLGRIKYYDTKIAIHSDPRFMPPNKDDWRVINIRYDGKNSEITVYKKWKSRSPVFRSWITYDVRAPKDTGNALPNNLYALIHYQHPIIGRTYFEVQKAVATLQGKQHLWFAGLWTVDNDSHESAVTSAMKIAEKLAPNSSRLKALQ